MSWARHLETRSHTQVLFFSPEPHSVSCSGVWTHTLTQADMMHSFASQLVCYSPGQSSLTLGLVLPAGVLQQVV